MILPRPKERIYVDLPQRKALLGGRTEVLVVGGSLAGIGAAWAAAKAGAKVVLAERTGFLGGDVTASLCAILMSYYTQHPKKSEPGSLSLFPADHGDGVPTIGGIFPKLIERLSAAGGAVGPSLETGFTMSIDPELFKFIALEMLEEAGVRLLFYASASGVAGGRNTEGVVFETKSGPVVINAAITVDCTGDGDVAFAAGAPCAVGRESDGRTQPITLYFLMGGFEREGFAGYVREHPDEWRDCYGLWSLVKKAQDADELSPLYEYLLMFGSTRPDRIVVDSARVPDVVSTDVWDMSAADTGNLRQVHQLARFLKKHVPGFERSYLEQSGSELYVRESRRIMGDYVLTEEDVFGARKFDDVIACGAYPIDLHSPTGSGALVKHLAPGAYYDIPLRALIPKDIENMLVAGRCISGTHAAQGSYRIESICAATGQAAGVCAALCVRGGTTPRRIDVKQVQEELLRQGAILHPAVHVMA